MILNTLVEELWLRLFSRRAVGAGDVLLLGTYHDLIASGPQTLMWLQRNKGGVT